MKHLRKGKTLAAAGAKAGMGESSAKKYRRKGKMPGECLVEHTWQTRPDPFAEVWEEVEGLLEVSPALGANTLFEELQRRYPGVFVSGQLRTLQRKVKIWRALQGPGKEVYFPQQHRPAELCQSDFTHLSSLGITISGQRFLHMLYHFVLTYSNWESGTICFTESMESLREGLQNALWELGGVPQRHRTDSLTAAVKPIGGTKQPGQKEEFTRSYNALMSHYGLAAEKTQPRHPNENGDVEQRHHRLKQRLEQALLLRGSREFASREEYSLFLKEQIARANQGRKSHLKEEMQLLRPLPKKRLEGCERINVRVGPSSTIRVRHNTYSVSSQLILEQVEVRLYAETVEVWYAQHQVEKMPRLLGNGGHQINYRHIIDWLVRKPGAFEQYRYRDALFPTSRFRMAYDQLIHRCSSHHKGGKEYLKILRLAALESEKGVDEALRHLLDKGAVITIDSVEAILAVGQQLPSAQQVKVDAVNLSTYDELLRHACLDSGPLANSPLANSPLANSPLANSPLANSPLQSQEAHRA